MATQQQLTTSDVLDHLAAAVSRVNVYGRHEARSYFALCMGDTDRLAFDLFLVRMNDPLAFEAGTCEQRFETRVLSMAELERQRQQERELDDRAGAEVNAHVAELF